MDVFFSSTFDYGAAKQWTHATEMFVVKLAAFYVVTIFSIKYFMRDRKPFDLQLPLNAWNAFLALFSVLGTLLLTPTFFGEIFNKGLTDSYCKINRSYTDNRAGYWTFLWVVSKIPELVDTIFIVLRKKPLMFMHWFHHVLTGYFAFISYSADNAYMIWIVYLNYTVHAFMYSYYFLRSLRIRVPPQVARMITASQIVQFLITHVVMIHLAYITLVQGRQCDVTLKSYLVGAFMELAYLFLFSRFYYISYIAGGGKKFVNHKRLDEQQKVE
uniref:Elongation of very long chain fatty acids protein n=1 Tax=Plectus sambesii TaxID=2011161 RepID=A0A914UXE6_9BILA